MARNVQVNQPLTRHEKRMRALKRQQRLSRILTILVILLLVLAGFCLYEFVFRSHELNITDPFSLHDTVLTDHAVAQHTNGRAKSFSADLCVSAGDVDFPGVSIQYAEAGTIMDLSERNVLYAKNIHETLYPASLTKIMTALVACKYGNLDEVIVVDELALDIDPESSICYLALGDQYTLRQLVYGLLIASGNDAANAIAYNVAGSIEGFVELMNQEAYEIGATNTHFTNAHGLQDENHYTTPYDIYLMFNEAMKYDTFSDAINQPSYTVTYTAADGEQYERTWFATSYYFTGESTPPDDVIIYGGKTGTTDEAGACLSLLSKDAYGNAYFSVIMRSDTKEDLYDEMNDLLSIITKKQL